MAPDTAQIKRLRGVIVELVYSRHMAQSARLDHVMLWHILRDVGCDVGEADVLTQLQDLCDRGYVKYREYKDPRVSRLSMEVTYVRIYEIQLTSRGRDLREGTIVDPAILF
jgi:hypothetical protein